MIIDDLHDLALNIVICCAVLLIIITLGDI